MMYNALVIPIIELIYNFAGRERAILGSME